MLGLWAHLNVFLQVQDQTVVSRNGTWVVNYTVTQGSDYYKSESSGEFRGREGLGLQCGPWRSMGEQQQIDTS